MPQVAAEPQPSRDQHRVRVNCSSLSSLLFTLSSLFWAVGPIRPSLVRGLRPRNAPSPTTCLADLVSKFGTGACPRGVRHTTFLQPRQSPVGAGLVPALERPTDGLQRKARPGACTASRQKTFINFCHRSHGFPARLSPPQIWDAPDVADALPEWSGMLEQGWLTNLPISRTVGDSSNSNWIRSTTFRV